jgi:hypothetical protein
MRILPRGWSLGPFLAAVIAAALVPVALGIWRYGDSNIWPGWIGSFSAGLLAFLAALYADRQWATQQAESAAADEDERRFTEARRAFHAILSELTEIADGLDDAIPKLTPGDGHEWWVLPSLPNGAWQALAPRLGVMVAEVQLIADLAAFSAKVDDVRWALRYRLEKGSESVESYATVGLSNWARERVESARDVLAGLLPRVLEQAAHPEVRPVGISFKESGTIRVRVHPTVTVATEVTRSDAPPPPEK